MYVVNELDSTVSVCKFKAATGVLEEMSNTTTLPEAYEAEAPFEFYTMSSHAAAILCSPCGRMVLVSNRGHDSIAVFKTGADGAELTLTGFVPCGGSLPWDMSFDKEAKILLVSSQYANKARPPEGKGCVAPFRVDTEAGTVTPAGDTWEVDLCMSVQVWEP